MSPERFLLLVLGIVYRQHGSKAGSQSKKVETAPASRGRWNPFAFGRKLPKIP